MDQKILILKSLVNFAKAERDQYIVEFTSILEKGLNTVLPVTGTKIEILGNILNKIIAAEQKLEFLKKTYNVDIE